MIFNRWVQEEESLKNMDSKYSEMHRKKVHITQSKGEDFEKWNKQ